MPSEKSPKSPKNSNEGVLGLSTSEARILILGIACCAEAPKIDFEKLASKAGYTSGSTKTIYGNARRKLQKAHGEDSGANPATPEDDGSHKAKKPRKSTAGRKRKRNKNEAEPEPEPTDLGEDQPTSPATEVVAEVDNCEQEQEA
ncbi:histone h1.3 [Penicillium hispanicum]|uniref:histone h1.3 n=1 Tax=Penicillium hispanicum TaxID=1080232 RepID=UPI0025420901|nr:histone h1.3 [Penicillium hispanicum]KAJ5594578.1 histone h1.3 [Penicillium hispanicum]